MYEILCVSESSIYSSCAFSVYRDAPQFNGSGCSSPLSVTSIAGGSGGHRSQTITAGNNSYTTTVNGGLYGYERSSQSPVNNFCRFPPSLVDVGPYPYDRDEPHDPTLDQQVSNGTPCTHRRRPSRGSAGKGEGRERTMPPYILK